jgi:hypothetical protein
MLNIAIDLMERGYVPDGLTRMGIRRLLAGRLRAEEARGEPARAAALEKLIAELRASPYRPAHSGGQCPALRTARRFFPEGARATAEIQFLLVAGRSEGSGNR